MLVLDDLSTEACCGGWYNYDKFFQWDEMAREFGAEFGLDMIDMSALFLRPDSHSDSLHYCMPGALNHFSIVLYNMLISGEM